VTNSTLSSNSATFGGGGGIFNDFMGTLTVSNSTLSGNSGGGGIFNKGTLTVGNSTLSGNSSAVAGGGIDNDLYGTLTVSNSTLSGNSSAYSGGGISNDGTLTVSNSIVAGNGATFFGPDLFGPLTSHGHNLFGDGTDAGGFDPTDLVGTASSPIDPLLGPLQDNGGPTQTMALLPGSPAIDAGDNTNAPTWDQRGPGYPRIVNGIIDIGAFEVQAPAASYPTRQPLPDPVPVQALGMPGGPVLRQPPDLPADPSLAPESGLPDGQTGQPEPVPVPTAAGQQAPATLFGTYPGTGQPVAALGSLSASDLDALALNMLGGP
jgi:hypothetical protein